MTSGGEVYLAIILAAFVCRDSVLGHANEQQSGSYEG